MLASIRTLPRHQSHIRTLSVFAALAVLLTATGTPAVASDSATGTYVTAVYHDLFGRNPDAAGLSTWSHSLESGTPVISVANAITSSDEFRARLITESYQTYLGRSPEPTGLANWLRFLRRGHTLQQMEAGFLAAPEYFTKAGGTNADWVRELYSHVLGRSATSTEVRRWVGAIASGNSRAHVAMGFLLSSEHLADVIDDYYQDLLGRGIDPSGRDTWVAAVQRGVRTEQIIGSIVSSSEYVNKNGGPLPRTVRTPVAPAPPAPPAPTPAPGGGTEPVPVVPTGGVGVPVGTSLTVHNGDITITTPGTVIDSLDVRGFVIVKAANVTIRNSIIRGSGPGSYNTGLINATSAGVSNLLIEDTTLVPSHPSVWIDGVLGHDFTARRVETYNVVDGFGVYNTTGPNANVTIDSSWVHDLSYFSGDPNHSDNRTHNDCIQIQGGRYITITNNRLDAYLSTTVGTGDAQYPEAGFGVILTPNVSAVSSATISGNHFTGSYIPVKLTTGTRGAMNFGRLENNEFTRTMRNVPMGGVSQWFTILTTPDLTATYSGNVYDDQTAITVRNDSGTSTAP